MIKGTKGIEFKINKDKIIFEGEYLNAERNGKAKECHSFYNEFRFICNKLKIEGEYKGKRWNGKRSQYNYDDETIFEGECCKENKLLKKKDFHYGNSKFFKC